MELPDSPQELYATAVRALQLAGVESAEYDATQLFQQVLEKPRYLWPTQLTVTEKKQLESVIQRRANREPLAYILGKMWFYRLELAAGPGTFCVRPETEILVEQALEWAVNNFPEGGRALDLCTGSGAIALAFKAHLPQWEVTGVEISADALEKAKNNAERLGLAVNLEQGDATRFNPKWERKIHLLVTNPPYVPPRTLPAETQFEPQIAFWGGGETGMEIPTRLIHLGKCYLQPGGLLLLEHDDTQGHLTREIALKLGYQQVKTLRDLNGIERFLYAQQPK